MEAETVRKPVADQAKTMTTAGMTTGNSRIDENPTLQAPRFLSMLGSLLLSPVQGVISVAWTLVVGLGISRLERALGAHPRNDPFSNFLEVWGASVLAGPFIFWLARFFPVLAKGAHLTCVFGIWLLLSVYGPFPSFTVVREAFSSPPGYELEPLFVTAVGLWLCSYSAFALLGTMARKKAGRIRVGECSAEIEYF